jgi:hypothetical protein
MVQCEGILGTRWTRESEGRMVEVSSSGLRKEMGYIVRTVPKTLSQVNKLKFEL